MDALTILKYKGMTPPRYQEVVRAEKPAASAQTQKTAGTTGLTVSETLRQLMSRVNQAENSIRESHRTLLSGETVLDEVRGSLDRIAELAKAAAAGEPGRAALQEEVERLREEIGRMINSAVVGDMHLFLDEETGIEDGVDALLQAVINETAAEQEGVRALPDWLLKGMSQGIPSPGQLLAALGLDSVASSSQILAAIASHPLDSSSATAYLAALYLGTVIAGGDPSGEIDPQQALEGLRQLLEAVQDGAAPDEAIERLTDGAFTSFADFEKQFNTGMAPALDQFLANVLLIEYDPSLLDELSLLTLLGGLEGIQMDMMMLLLDILQNSETTLQQEAGAGSAGSAGPNADAGLDAAPTAAPAAAAANTPANTSVLQLGNVQVMGRDLSGVSYDASTGVLTVDGTADVTVRGTGENSPAVLITGSGTVSLQSVNTPSLTVSAAAARVFTAGETVLHEVRLTDGASLTLESSGRLETGVFHSGSSSTLRLTGGAVVMQEKSSGTLETLSVPVLLDGSVSLAAHAVNVSNFSGKQLEPFDIIWKTLLPGWNSITSMTVDGSQAKMSLQGGVSPDPARLWLEKGDASHGYPIHTVAIRGQDRSGQLQTRYTYLRWDRRRGTFLETSMYPNPFTVTGGAENLDWIYEECTQTLHILSDQVTAVSGGAGISAELTPFNGRISLADRIGVMKLALNGVVCRVSSGRAFNLGCENDVTLILQSGANNIFKSGRGCAGISLRDSTSLCIDCAAAHSSRDPAGTLTATGGAGGAGIGRDSNGSRDQTSRILIRGGVITATGTGGGAGIGAGKHGAMGPVTILGGTVTATGGKGGGAGIGGALGAPAGDISIRGGTVSASAAGHAAAIGAGMQGASGDILITGTARILKAAGGDPGADIGSSLFGGCGNVRITGGADIGCAQLRTHSGIPLRMGETTVTLPQFRLSPRSLRLDRLSVLTREYAQAAVKTIDADRRWVAQIQSVYRALYTQLEQSRLHNARQYINVSESMVRDTDTASTLLKDMSRSIPLQSPQTMSTHGKRDMDDVRRLLW